MSLSKTDLRSANRIDMEKLVALMGEPKFRAGQMFKWLHKFGVVSFGSMTDLPLHFRERLREECSVYVPEVVDKQESGLDGTKKLLLKLEDDQTVESVIMPHEDNSGRCTVCVSSQVGCSVGCVFCATGSMGFVRDLRVSEILSQVYIANEIGKQKQEGWQVSNVVFMGMGEPFLNYSAVMKSLRILIDPQGLNIGQRRIVVSTAGFIPGIYQMAEENIQAVLAISLHAAENQLRDRLVPLNRRYPLEELAEACRFFNGRTGKRITFEYALIDKVNDTSECAENLAKYVKPLLSNVNIIPLNQVSHLEYKRSSSERIRGFVRILQARGIEAVIRRERGSDIAGACGQLRCKNKKSEGI